MIDNPCITLNGYNANFQTASCDKLQYRDSGSYIDTRHTNGVWRRGKYKTYTLHAYDDAHYKHNFNTDWMDFGNNTYLPQTWTNRIHGFGSASHQREIRTLKKYFTDLWFLNHYNTGTVTSNLLDAVPCSTSNECYALTIPSALHNGNVLNKESNAWKNVSTNKFLTKKINNKYVDNENIALNAIGFNTVCNKYYTVHDLPRYAYYGSVYTFQISNRNYINYGGGEATWEAISDKKYNYAISKPYCYYKGTYKGAGSGWTYYSVGRILIVE